MKIKAGSWSLLTPQDKLFILEAVSSRSKNRKQEEQAPSQESYIQLSFDI
ncbi:MULTISPECIES: hypothetical protein [Bacillales]|jgi:predicted Fe-S protein YdhL (DUF1289 family)|nr:MULTISPECIES: hypothetical protein [Bacillales]